MPMTPFQQVLHRGFGEPAFKKIDDITDRVIVVKDQMLANVRKMKARETSREAEFQEASIAVCSLSQAEQYKLSTEWMVEFLREIRAGSSVGEAVAAAESEWDL